MAFAGSFISGGNFDSRKILVREMANLDRHEDYIAGDVNDGKRKRTHTLQSSRPLGPRGAHLKAP